MSVYMLLQVKGDVKRVQETMRSAPDRWEAINARAKGLGAIHHQFATSGDGGTIFVFDEWESAEGFQKFFDSSPEIGEMMAAAGVTERPQITFLHPLETPDAF
jgi:hypothetical protein